MRSSSKKREGLEKIENDRHRPVNPMKTYRKYFQKAIEAHFPQNEDALMADVDAGYRALQGDVRFSRSSKNPMDRRLDIAAYFLSLIEVLDGRGESFERIRQICLEIAQDSVRPKTRFQAWRKRRPVKLIGSRISRVLLRYLDRKLGERGHPDGFVSRIVTDKDETFGLGYGVDILECGICKLFERHGYGKYASILCEVDYVTSGIAGLTLVRSGTIANGADKCDFRFKRERPADPVMPVST